MRKLLFLLYCLLSFLPLSAQQTSPITSLRNGTTKTITLGNNAKIYILTCTPGQEVWSKYGHTGIRVVDISNKLDIVFNYGIFSLMDEGFYIKFIKGETYYRLGIESYRQFNRFYSSIGRTTYWQELNLTQQQKQQIFDALLINYQPENRYYLYNFVFDNCATRPYYLIKKALQDSIISTYTGYCDQPYRSTIAHYTRPHSWVDFGINLIFGPKADMPMNNEQRLFLPEELMFYISQAYLSDGTPLVKQEHIEPFVIEPVPWYVNCWVGIALFAIIIIAISLFDRKRGQLSWWIDAIMGIIYVILLAIVIFLTFFSIHPLVGFSWRLIIIPLIHLCARLIYIIR